ncbi:cell adhesion molecule CEACAM3-like [Macrotis lagotis]|uniref:cell adhesion molecule CEACAM3-like n=1 Tax=Macrotis lagotis TaxID=92651 RepID=UPI003D682F39
MAFFLSWQFLPHGSWKVVFFTASILSSWNATVWAEVTITQTPTKAVVGRSIMLSVQSDQKNILSFTWFRNSKNNQFCVIRPGENYKNCTNQNPGHVITYSNGSLILQNLSSRDSGLYLIKVNSLEGMEFWSEKYIQVNDSWESPRTSQPGEVNLIFIVAIAVLAGLVIIGGLSCILFIRHTKRNSKKQLEDLGPDGKRHVTRIHSNSMTFANYHAPVDLNLFIYEMRKLNSEISEAPSSYGVTNDIVKASLNPLRNWMAFFLSWQFLPHGSWKVVFFTASILSSWNATVWAEVTITQTPTKAVVGRSIMLSVQSDQKNILSFTWFRNSKNNQFCVIRPGENYKNCTNQNPGHVITYSNGSLILQNLSSRDSGLYLIKVNSLEGMEFWSEKYIQVNDSWESPRTSQPGEVNLIFIVAIAVLAGLVIIGGLSCILFIRHTKRNSKKQLEDLGPDGKRHVTRIHKVFQTYENDSQSQVLHTYENQSQSPVLPTYENHPQARDGMAITQNQSFASASFSTLSEKPYEVGSRTNWRNTWIPEKMDALASVSSLFTSLRNCTQNKMDPSCPLSGAWKGLLLTASFLTSWSLPGDAHLTICTSTPTAIVGQNVLLSVQGLQKKSLVYSWFHGLDDQNLILSYNISSKTQTKGPSYTGQEELYENASLLIKNVKKTKARNYTFQEVMLDLSTATASKQLQVFKMVSKPRITANTTSIIEAMGSVAFKCLTKDTGITIQWYLNNKAIPPSRMLSLSKDNRTLTLLKTRRKDHGMYQCEVGNQFDLKSSDHITLTVNYGPDHMKITQEPGSHLVHNIKVDAKSTLTLRCQAESRPSAQYDWLFNSSTLVANRENLTLHGGSLTPGNYTCSAYNSLTNRHVNSIISIEPLREPGITLFGLSYSTLTIASILVGILVVMALLIVLACLQHKKAQGYSQEGVGGPSQKEKKLLSMKNSNSSAYENVLQLPHQVSNEQKMAPTQDVDSEIFSPNMIENPYQIVTLSWDVDSCSILSPDMLEDPYQKLTFKSADIYGQIGHKEVTQENEDLRD